jgi:predicted RND superfamily exporter protein
MSVQSVVRRLSGWLFGHRGIMLALFAAITVVLVPSATQLRADAGFKKMIPLTHPYMKTFVDYESTFGGANRVVVALLRKDGTIFDADYMKALKAATDDVFFVPGVDRATVQSLFTPNVRFIEVVEEGFAGGNVIPATFQGTAADLATVAVNVQKAGLVGRLVSNDLRGALIRADLLDADPQTGKRLAYASVAQKLEAIRGKYENASTDVAIIGFAKAVGDITDGARGVLLFFFVAFVITALLLRWYSRSTLLTGVALVCAILPVLWLLGTLPLIGFGIDPLSVLVPFLIFSIGCSHAVQMTNTWRLEVQAGAEALDAAKSAFAKLFVPGTLALLTNALGFLAIMFIKIDIVRELGLTATLGVTLMIVTNKMVLPILLSYLPTEKIAAAGTGGAAAGIEGTHRIWHVLSRCAERRVGVWIILASVVLAGFGAWKAKDLTVGDLGQGVPELRDDSRYNRDNASITRNFAIGVDVLAVVAQSHNVQGACTQFDIVDAIDEFEWAMKNVDGVHSTMSLPGLAKGVNAGWNEGAVKWRVLSRAPEVLAQSVTPIDTGTGLLNSDCSAMQVLLFMNDHQGATLARVVQAVKDYNTEFTKRPLAAQLEFKLASGHAGVMAATNEAVAAAKIEEVAALFAALVLMCLLTFRSVAATLCIILPLALVSLLNNALMAMLGIGVKVSTLPVIALGVGVGVDYGIYLYDRIEAHLHEGLPLREAYYRALVERGAAAAFTAITMSIGVGSWVFSALKFQADMGLLLSFMFFVNMLGAVFLLPALLAFFLDRRKRVLRTLAPVASHG